MDWIIKYRPPNLDSMYLTSSYKKRLEYYINNKFPNLQIIGKSGTGKNCLVDLILSNKKYTRLQCDQPDMSLKVLDSIFCRTICKQINRQTIVIENMIIDKINQKIVNLMEQGVKFIFIFNPDCINRGHNISESINSRCHTIDLFNPPRDFSVAFIKNILIKEKIKFSIDDINTLLYNTYDNLKEAIIKLQLLSKISNPLDIKIFSKDRITYSNNDPMESVKLFKRLLGKGYSSHDIIDKITADKDPGLLRKLSTIRYELNKSDMPFLLFRLSF